MLTAAPLDGACMECGRERQAIAGELVVPYSGEMCGKPLDPSEKSAVEKSTIRTRDPHEDRLPDGLQRQCKFSRGFEMTLIVGPGLVGRMVRFTAVSVIAQAVKSSLKEKP